MPEVAWRQTKPRCLGGEPSVASASATPDLRAALRPTSMDLLRGQPKQEELGTDPWEE